MAACIAASIRILPKAFGDFAFGLPPRTSLQFPSSHLALLLSHSSIHSRFLAEGDFRFAVLSKKIGCQIKKILSGLSVLYLA
jgi:hypothetical protein